MFWTNGAYVRWASSNGQKPMTYFAYDVGGSVAWGVGAIIECPLQLASSQLQVQIVNSVAIPPTRRSTAAFSITSASALYHGLAPQLLRNVVGGFLHFGAFELLRRENARRLGVPVAEVGLATARAQFP
jgi:hypothetical protein